MIRIAEARGWRRFLIAFAAGAVTALSLPPLGLWFLPCLSVPVFVWLLDGARCWRGGFATGWSFGFGYFCVALHWIGFAFFIDANQYLWMMPFMLGALTGGMALYWGIAGAVAKRFWRPGLSRLLLIASLVAVVEILRGHLLTGFPWGAPGLAIMGNLALAQSASLFGMTGLTFILFFWWSLPSLLPDAPPARVASIAALLLLPALAFAFGELRLSAPAADVPGVRLRIVQPNVAQDQKWRAENVRGIFEGLMSLSFEGGDRPTHILWPESALPFYVEESDSALARFAAALGDDQVLIMGALRRDREDRAYNSILAFDGEANVIARYDKWRLVPGGEFLPFASLLKPLGFERLIQTPGDFIAGPGPVTLPVPGAPEAGFLVCYEAIFPDRLVSQTRRPGWLVAVTNDGWFGKSTGPYQHFDQLRLRAIEQGLPAARSANTGISGVIDPFGRALHSLGLGERGIVEAGLPAALEGTVYSRFGDWMTFVLVFAALGSSALLNLWRSRGRDYENLR